MDYFKRRPLYFLCIYLFVGVFTFRDFGVPIDDFTQYVIGQQNYHVLIGEENIENIDPGIKYYGPVFETFCYTIDSMFYGEPEPIQKWGMRHCFVFALFTLSLFYLWNLAFLLFKDYGTAWLIMLLTAWYPRLFADAHYNSKDTVFLSLFLIGLYFLCKACIKKETIPFLVAGIILGVASTLRLAGFFILPALLFSQAFAYPNYQKKKLWIWQPMVFILIFFGAYYVFFPALWHHPIREFMALVKHITDFPWPNKTLVAGVWVGPDNMPWWYFPVWFFITVPVLYHIFFLMAAVLLFRNFHYYANNAAWRIILLFFFGNLIYMMVLRPNLYDSWRQLQFLFVPFMLLSGISWYALLKTRMGHRWMAGILVLYHFGVCVWFHPYQYIYFNEAYWIAGKPNTYDQDYWGLSTGKSMQWIARHAEKKKIHIYTRNTESGWYNSFFFPKDSILQMEPVSHREQADYEIEPIRNTRPFDPKQHVVYSICPLKDTISRVIQLNPTRK